MNNCTNSGRQLINERKRSNSINLNQGHTAIFSKKAEANKAWTKFLGEHTIMSHKQIGWKNNLTGKITKL
jgi:hypothetical protein